MHRFQALLLFGKASNSQRLLRDYGRFYRRPINNSQNIIHTTSSHSLINMICCTMIFFRYPLNRDLFAWYKGHHKVVSFSPFPTYKQETCNQRVIIVMFYSTIYNTLSRNLSSFFDSRGFGSFSVCFLCFFFSRYIFVLGVVPTVEGYSLLSNRRVRK